MLNSAERSFLKTWLCYSIPKLFVEFLIVRAVLLWIFWTFVAILIEKKNDFFSFSPFDFNLSHSYLYRK